MSILSGFSGRYRAFKELAALRQDLKTYSDELIKLRQENAVLSTECLRSKEAMMSTMNENNDLKRSLASLQTTIPNESFMEPSSYSDNEDDHQDSTTSPTFPTSEHLFLKTSVGEAQALECDYSSSKFAVTGSSGDIEIYDGDSAQSPILSFSNDKPLTSLEFSKCGKFLFSGGSGRCIDVWDLAQVKLKSRLFAHQGKICGISSAQDPCLLLSGAIDRKMLLWDTTKSTVRTTFNCNSSINDVILSRHDDLAIAAHLSGTFSTWDTRSSSLVFQPPKLHSARVSSVSLFKEHVVVTMARDNSICFTDLRNFEKVMEIKNPALVVRSDSSSFCFSRDSRYLYAGSVDGKILVFNTVNGDLEGEIKGRLSGAVISCRVVNDGHLLAVDKEGSLSLFKK
ncbi:hypothetical protein GEMRC1_001716 [Eukaryota sp. GEM-RC1]